MTTSWSHDFAQVTKAPSRLLVRQHQPSLLRLAEAFVGSRAVAEEVVQDTWLAVCKGADCVRGAIVAQDLDLHDPRQPGAVDGVAGAPQRAGRRRRVRGLLRLLRDLGDAPVPWSEKVDDEIVARQFAKLVSKVLPDLPDAQQQVLMLRDVEGLPAAEVATLLSISDGNQRVLLHRARCRIRQHLENAMGGEWS